MTPLSKVTTLETSRLLKEAGFPQETERWWIGPINGEYSIVWNENHALRICAAPDAQELGEALLQTKKVEFEITRNPYTDLWAIAIRKDGQLMDVFDGENEAECRASAWLFLRKQGLV